MSGPIRDPHRFGNHEANAVVRYVEVYEILPDPGEEDDFPEPYQPVQVKALRFEGYVSASTAVIETDNTDIVLRTRKSGKKHGTRGNGIDLIFEIDAGITPPASAAFDEATDELTVKVKTTSTTWQEVSEAVAGVLGGAFILEAVNPNAQVGSGIESETGTTASGADGAYATYGSAFGIGDHDTKDGKSVGDKFWIVWRADPRRWEILTGGGGGGGTVLEGRVTALIPSGRRLNGDGDAWLLPGEGDMPATWGKFVPVDNTGNATGPEVSVTHNRTDQEYEVDCQVFYIGSEIQYGNCWAIDWPPLPE